MFDDVQHLFARHEAVGHDAAFLEWLRLNGAAFWYDTGFSAYQPQVVVVSFDETELWAAVEVVDEADDFPKPRVVKTATVDLTQLPPKEAVVREALAATSKKRQDLVSAKPVVTFLDNGTAAAEWVVEIETEGGIASFSADQGLVTVVRPFDRSAWSKPTRLYLADDLAANELHSPYLFAAEAQQWTQGPLTVFEKARRIGGNVAGQYRYDGSINLISEFTWADHLVRDRNGRAGICDEWAVVQISYLRSIGIPARLKYLIWQKASGEGVGHACLEFFDGIRWIHMDALWNAIDYPGRYRASGNRNVTVMDADYPSDARSNVPAWGKPDLRGDGLLYPYGDFILSPGYPGNARAGYSS